MYRRILVAVENSAADRTILDHVRQLAMLTNAEILLVHVADGWAARHFNDLQLRGRTRSGPTRLSRGWSAASGAARHRAGNGRPANELVGWSREASGLLAMSTPGTVS
jgi:nucleotide-binding universal stress UspA family protein